ncbi:NAD(P)H-quinone oxidoreductase [uncultured Gilvimarinus sp.]|mgnify:CR=1 FL=1|uniref:NAD(P)H-quinone oxidoreductase n=1 Tax=uncultured Gilvimarinus sp. TaxID=1689143 RepID=UPI0030DB2219
MSLPSSIKAQAIVEQQLRLQSVACPCPRAQEVLINVAAAGVNRPDVMQRQGLYPPPEDASPLPGLEVAGTVVACGAEVSRWQVGDQVCALVNGGGYAEYCVAPAGQVLPIPQGFSPVQAAALPETFFTVWHNVFQRGALKAGETLLLHGGTSGIGTTAIMLAKAFGARVLCTAGSDEKCQAAQQLGADLAINYRTEDFVARVKAEGGADVILDMVGGDYIARNIKAAAVDGRIVNIAYLSGSKVELDFVSVMLKRLTLTGSTLRARSSDAKAALARELEQRVWPLLNAGSIKPLIAAEFPLAEAAAAHELMESSRHIGKIVLTP